MKEGTNKATNELIDLTALQTAVETTARIPLGVPMIEFLKPSQITSYVPPEGSVLVGDCHIVKGAVFVIGGAPGVGKSRASVALAVAGASQKPWFGFPTHRQFKTLIIQNENGRHRLQKEFSGLDIPGFDDCVRICPPPPFGLAFDHPEFRAAIAAALADFQPDVVLIDPWNAAARDDKARDYLETFATIRSVIPAGDTSPALGIVAHTRKPRAEEAASGRGLNNLLSGSYVLVSVPRSVFIIQAASDEQTDDRVVFTCSKNNDGECGEASAWRRRNGLFEAVADFDWKEFREGAAKRVAITEDDVRRLFASEDGPRQIERAHAAKELQEQTGAGRTAAYLALKPDGRFAYLFREANGFLALAGSDASANTVRTAGG